MKWLELLERSSSKGCGISRLGKWDRKIPHGQMLKEMPILCRRRHTVKLQKYEIGQKWIIPAHHPNRDTCERCQTVKKIT